MFPIETDRLLLFPPHIDLLAQVVDYFKRNRYHFEPWGPAREPAWDTEEYHRDKIIHYGKQLEAGNNVWLFLFAKQNPDRIIGDVHLSNITRGIFQSCNLGYKLDEAVQGFGYMHEALQKVVTYAFDEMKLHRIEANIMPANKRSIKLVTSLGFEEEGLAKKYLKINGRWEDHLHFVKLNGEVE